MTTQTTQQLTRDTLEIPYRHVTTHFIDGAWRESHGQDTIEVIDPATNTVWGSVPVGNENDVNAAVEADDIRPFPNGQGKSLVRKDPIGVCALIAPWNFPINLMVTKLAPALLAGCTVVMKPASPTPLSFRIIVDAVTAAGVAAGVVNYVTGPGRMGDLMVRHPKVAKVAFTGSTPVGRHIAAACGELLRPVTLELGGKSSAIVMEDADLNDMSTKLIRLCMRNTGQTCYISTRILAPASRYNEVVDMVTETIAAAPQGDHLDPGTVFGPSA